MNEEKRLYGSIGSGHEEEPLKPRENKPSTYGLYVDGELREAYPTAFDALKGLRDEPKTVDQQVELRDMDGNKLAEKRLSEVLNRTNLLQSAHYVPRLALTDDMKRDLISEGRDPLTPFRDVQPRPSQQVQQSAESSWRAQLLSKHLVQVKGRDIGDDRESAAQSTSWRAALMAMQPKQSQGGADTADVGEKAVQPSNWRAALMAMQPDRSQDVEESDSTFLTVVSPPDPALARNQDVDMS
jgi:hypothetical protein